MGRISYSQLSMFSECPKHWKLKYIDDLALQEPSIHLLFSGDGYKICEVNSNPGFEGMEKYTKKNVAEEIVQFIKMKIGLYDE